MQIITLKKIIAVLSLIFLFLPVIYGQDTAPAFISDSLDNYIFRSMEQWKIPGMAIAIVKDGEIVLEKGYGVTEFAGEQEVDNHTLFMIGSNTKAFTATALASLAYQQKCSLNDPVIKWVPAFTMLDPWVKEHTNLVDILCHRVGMETFQGDFMLIDSDLSPEEMIGKMGQLIPEIDFRTGWGYYNTGYIIAGMAIESISELSWEKFIEQKFFEPLEMNRSLALVSQILTEENRAVAHTLIDNEIHVINYGNIDNIAPAASISSSVSDMTHWLKAQLNEGNYNGKEVIPSPVINTTREPRSIIGKGNHPFNKNNFMLYGLGWRLQDYEGYELVSHTGGIHGFVSSVTLLPEMELGIVILTNTDMNGFYEALKWDIIDAYLDMPFRNYSTFYHNIMSRGDNRTEQEIRQYRDTIQLKKKPPLPLRSFRGTYKHDVYGKLEIVKKGDHLLMKFEHHPDLVGKLEYITENYFLCTYSIPIYGILPLQFKIEDGTVKSITVRLSDFIEKGVYNFYKVENN